jgi:DnaJ-class molecular chaperone
MDAGRDRTIDGVIAPASTCGGEAQCIGDTVTRRVVFVAKSIECKFCKGTGLDHIKFLCAFCNGTGRYNVARTAEDFSDERDIFIEPDRRQGEQNGKT